MMENNALSRGYKLRPLKPSDAPFMLEWMHDSDVTQYLRLNGADATKTDALRFIESARDESQTVHRAIVDESDTYLGTVSLKDIKGGEAEYAIALRKCAMGTGAAQVATELIWDYGFETLGLTRIYLNVLEENQRAIRFYTRAGFSPAGKTTTDYKGIPKELLWYEKRKDLL